MINFFRKYIDNIKGKLFPKRNNINLGVPPKIEFKNKFYYINSKQFSVFDIDSIHYGVGSLNDQNLIYYIRLKCKNEPKNNPCKQGYELANIDNFIKVINEFNIPVLPTILQGSPYLIKGVLFSLNYECFLHEKYLASIHYSDLKKKSFNFYSINLDELLENPKIYITSSPVNDKEFNIKLLSKKLTLNRGYGVYPVLNNEIIIDDIFYSFNEEEVKDRIEKLFIKYTQPNTSHQ